MILHWARKDFSVNYFSLREITIVEPTGIFCNGIIRQSSWMRSQFKNKNQFTIESQLGNLKRSLQFPV